MLSWHNETADLVWVYPQENPELVEKIVKEFKIHPVVAQVFVSRGFTTLPQIHTFLYARLPDLCDPFLMVEMPQAVQRIAKAMEKGEGILIYGDNDVDGMTGTALLTEFFRYIGANVFFYVSNRGAHRGSLIVEALEYALKNECKLLITVDCGITAAGEIAKVVENDIDVIITDHHAPTDKIPNCVATLNPKLVNNSYPNLDITGVGVAFKLAHAVTEHLTAEGKLPLKKVDLKRYLDLVALGTISDMGTLQGENRILVSYGLHELAKRKRLGLSKLMSISDVDLNDLSTFTIASKVAPRLNSLGRIDDPQKGVQMLLIRNAVAAEKMALELDLNNIERQKIERAMAADIENKLLNNPEILTRKAIIMHSENWHPGVIAILSTRIAKYYNRPTVIMACDDKFAKGSLRSIPEFPLLPILDQCSDILVNYGGHDFAAGVTLKLEHIEEFKRRFIEAAEAILKDSDVLTKLRLDAKIDFDELTFDFMESLRLLEPYGNGNPQPVLYCDAKQAFPPKVLKKTHLKLYLVQGEGDRMLEGIALGKASQSPLLRKKDLVLRIAFTPQINNYQGQSIQLMIRDFQILGDAPTSTSPFSVIS